MEEIVRFVTLAQTNRFTVTDLCEQFGISRKTGYKHLERYATSDTARTRRHSQNTSNSQNTKQPEHVRNSRNTSGLDS